MGTDSTIINDLRNRVEDAREKLFRARRRKRSQRCLAAHALKVVRATKGARASRPVMANLKKRFKGHAAGYLRFLGERIEPTNNVAERALRHCVLDRKVTQGTRGETGERWCERAWTVVMTCRKHGRSAFEFFRESLRAYTNDAPAPSLLKNP
ncbi:MAG: transposase [Planctomycetes bacterium]|nr:transposase [Planctomycetota bacterium]